MLLTKVEQIFQAPSIRFYRPRAKLSVRLKLKPLLRRGKCPNMRKQFPWHIFFPLHHSCPFFLLRSNKETQEIRSVYQDKNCTGYDLCSMVPSNRIFARTTLKFIFSLLRARSSAVELLNLNSVYLHLNNEVYSK